MERIYRKLQRLGGSFVISLPIKWIENYDLNIPQSTEKLTTGKVKNVYSTVSIDIQENGSLTISPRTEQTSENIQESVVLEADQYVVWELLKKSLAGETYITISSDKEINRGLINSIRYFVDRLPNTEITEQTKHKIVIQNFGYKQIPTKKLIQRLLYLTSNMFENLANHQKKDLKYNFDQLRKFYFILVIHIRTYLRTGVYVTEESDFTPLQAMDYRMFCEKIVEIAEILKDLKLNKNIIEYFKRLHHYFDEVIDAFLKNPEDPNKDKLAYYAWLKKDQLVERVSVLAEGLDYVDKDKIKDMIRIAQKCKDMAALI